jgi:hypothetical protein
MDEKSLTSNNQTQIAAKESQLKILGFKLVKPKSGNLMRNLEYTKTTSTGTANSFEGTVTTTLRWFE